MTKEQIKLIRDGGMKKGLRTDREIAEYLGMTCGTFSKILHGKSDFQMKHMRILAKDFGLSKDNVYALLF